MKITAIALAALALAGCSASPYSPTLELGIGNDLRDHQRVRFDSVTGEQRLMDVRSDPVGIVRIRQPLKPRGWWRLHAEYEHISSIPTMRDGFEEPLDVVSLFVSFGGDQRDR